MDSIANISWTVLLSIIKGGKNMKKWYLSKTLWINLVAAIALIAQLHFGFIVSPEEQLAILTLINLAVRIVTKEELEK